MSTYEIIMPDIGEGVTEAEITEWNVKVGDPVREDDVIAEVMTDKATVEIPSPVDGTVAALTGEIGDTIAVGTVIVTLEVTGDRVASGQSADTTSDAARSDVPVAGQQAKADVAAPEAAGKSLAPPAVRRRALEAGIDLADVKGSGPDGRITSADLDAWLEKSKGTTTAETKNQRGGKVTEIRVLGLRRKIAEHMEAATARIASMSYVEEVDVTDLETLREQQNSNLDDGQTRLTVLPFLMLAITRALKKNPKLNAHYDDEAGLIRQYDAVHMGIATQTPDGLLVPVIARVDTLDVWQLASEIARLADAAKSGKLARDELTGSTITLSSLGAMGGLVSTPIINAPEVAIVGVNKIAMRQVWRDDAFVGRKIMNLSSSFDHRVIDGWDAAVFIQDVKTSIENPAALLQGS